MPGDTARQQVHARDGLTQWQIGKDVPIVPVGMMRQLVYMLHMYNRIAGLDGDVVECGLGNGNTLVMLMFLASRETRKPTVWGFDSFEGWPEPTATDLRSARNPKKGEWVRSEEGVRELIRQSQIKDELVQVPLVITKGFLGASLPATPIERIKFLHLDVDLEIGYRDGLKYLWDKIIPGGMLLLDEYQEIINEPPYNGAEKWPGCTLAVDEFFRDRREKPTLHVETGKYYIQKF